jgi:hypothetical protein
MRMKCRAAMVSPLTPHTPNSGSPPKGLMLHGPIEQCRQHRPVIPKPHCGCCASSLSQLVVNCSSPHSAKIRLTDWSTL